MTNKCNNSGTSDQDRQWIENRLSEIHIFIITTINRVRVFNATFNNISVILVEELEHLKKPQTSH